MLTKSTPLTEDWKTIRSMYYFLKHFSLFDYLLFKCKCTWKDTILYQWSFIFFILLLLPVSGQSAQPKQKHRAVRRCLKSGRQRFESLKLFFTALWILRDFLSLCLLPYGCSLRPRNSKEMLGPSRFQNSSSPIKLQLWNLEQRNRGQWPSPQVCPSHCFPHIGWVKGWRGPIHLQNLPQGSPWSHHRGQMWLIHRY